MSSLTCCSLSQVLTLDSTLHVKHSDRTSGFTSPSHFSSPSAQVRACPSSSDAPVSPDSMALRSDTDCISNASSLSAQQASPSPSALRADQANSEDEGSHTATVTVQPRGPSAQEMYKLNRSGPGAGDGKLERKTSLEDPVVLSL